MTLDELDVCKKRIAKAEKLSAESCLLQSCLDELSDEGRLSYATIVCVPKTGQGAQWQLPDAIVTGLRDLIAEHIESLTKEYEQT